jgi:propanediol dehydratase large subunit
MQVTDKMIDAAIIAGGFDCRLTNDALRADMKAAIQAAIQTAWISVEDRLPKPVYIDGIEQTTEYLVYDVLNKKVSHDYFHTSRLDNGLKGWSHYGHHVTHWMHLPKYEKE